MLLKIDTAQIFLSNLSFLRSQLDLVKAIRAGDAPLKTVPIIILTTESQADMKQKGKDAGATAWVVKPFPPEEIIAAVKRLIG